MPDAGYRIQVTDHGSQITRIELYSTDGRMILEQGIEGNELDISDLPAGLYLIRIFDRNDVYTGRFIKK
jgi:hypothetical protein